MEEKSIPQECRQAAVSYKKDIAGRFILVEEAKLESRIQGSAFSVTRKIDGHMQAVFWRNGAVLMLNSQGRVKAEGLKCLDAFAEALKKARIGSATIIAELYAPSASGRERCGGVNEALADPEKRDTIRLAPFDITELDGEAWKPENYRQTHAKLSEIFTGEPVLPVPMKKADSIAQVREIYESWVRDEGAEGLVVHSDLPYVWKVKPRHSIDAAVIGYTTGDEGVRDLMLAVMRPDGLYQMFAVGSGGLSEADRKSLAEELGGMHVPSGYVLSDSRGIAYQMVSPGPVFEVTVTELTTEDGSGRAKTSPVLRFSEGRGWTLESVEPGVRALGLVFVRRRSDKQPNETDIRISQITDLVPLAERTDSGGGAPSTLLERRVFKKEQKGKVMLHKFVLWKTNKDEGGRFPAYVLYHTDFSSSRKEAIKRDLLYSSDEGQIRELMAAEIDSSVKKGWEEV